MNNRTETGQTIAAFLAFAIAAILILGGYMLGKQDGIEDCSQIETKNG